MKFEFFSIPACSPEQGQQELNSFCSSHRIASIEKQFVANGEQNPPSKFVILWKSRCVGAILVIARFNPSNTIWTLLRANTRFAPTNAPFQKEKKI
jgi:hypothetical protein